MEEGNDVKATLSIYMQTLDLIGYTFTLKNTKVSLNSLQEHTGLNIFHEIANCIVKEVYLLQYFEILISEFQDRYFSDYEELVKSMINVQTEKDRQTPLMLALRHDRKVIIN